MDNNLTPKAIVADLNKHIIGQDDAKRAVAIALRNRWRRLQVADDMRGEITPKNILMIGSTGIGKTEIARRLARLADAPFLKVEATKFTEVGYVGREVESIIKDLVEVSFKNERTKKVKQVEEQAHIKAEDQVLDVLLRPAKTEDEWQTTNNKTRETFREKIRSGELDSKEIEIEVKSMPIGMDVFGPPGMEEMTGQLQNIFSQVSEQKKKKKSMKIADALIHLREEAANELVKEEDVKQQALQSVEQSGIVFIDEIDKIVRTHESRGADVSREGVQRDLLPLIEGSSVTTRHGMVKTDHILFIASGSFQMSRPSDLIPELQGRLPIRVELQSLGAKELKRILTEPDYCLIEQYRALLKTEGLELTFTDEAISRIADIAWQVNENTENIGARRLHTFMERILEDISFHADTRSKEENQVTIDEDFINERLGEVSQNEDLSRYIL